MRKRILSIGSFLCVLLCLVSAVLCLPVSAAVSAGHVRGDATVTPLDALAILRSSVGLEKFSTLQKFQADVNGSGSIDPIDALYILRHVVGLDPTFPIMYQTGKVTGSDVNLRSGPGTSYASLGKMQLNETVTIYGHSFDGWYHIVYQGKEGYCSTSYLTRVGQAVQPQQPDNSNSGDKARSAVTTDNLRLRKGPGTNYDTILTIPAGATITVYGEAQNGWYRVSYNGKEGYCSADYISFGSSPPNDKTTLWARIYNPSTGVYETDYYPTYELLCRITEAEMGASFEPEALKAQVIAIHSYILYYNRQGKYSPSLPAKPMSSVSQRVKDAVSAVYDEVVCYQGVPIEAVYSASSAGRTNSAQEIWGGNVSYLQSVESKYDSYDRKNWDYKTTISLTELKSLLEAAGYSTSGYAPADWIKPIDYTSGNFVNRMQLCGKEVKGNYFRETILKGKIRSACFTAQLSSDGKSMEFTTRGYGHGVGMSQWGANFYASKAGWNYKQILTHYYTGVSIIKWS